jgi:hypothetical protein
MKCAGFNKKSYYMNINKNKTSVNYDGKCYVKTFNITAELHGAPNYMMWEMT